MNNYFDTSPLSIGASTIIFAITSYLTYYKLNEKEELDHNSVILFTIFISFIVTVVFSLLLKSYLVHKGSKVTLDEPFFN